MIEWTFEELEKNKTALCFCEGSWIPREMMFQAIEKLENDFAYVRFMGERDLLHFDKIYRNEDTHLQIWKDEIEKIKAKNTFVYFSNFFEGHAPASVNKLKELFGQKVVEASDSGKSRLFILSRYFNSALSPDLSERIYLSHPIMRPKDSKTRNTLTPPKITVKTIISKPENINTMPMTRANRPVTNIAPQKELPCAGNRILLHS